MTFFEIDVRPHRHVFRSEIVIRLWNFLRFSQGSIEYYVACATRPKTARSHKPACQPTQGGHCRASSPVDQGFQPGGHRGGWGERLAGCRHDARLFFILPRWRLFRFPGRSTLSQDSDVVRLHQPELRPGFLCSQIGPRGAAMAIK